MHALVSFHGSVLGLPVSCATLVISPPTLVAAVSSVLQVGAELRASAVLEQVLDEPCPLMAPVLEQSANPGGSTLTVYQYAGPSAEQMLHTRWACLKPQQREPLCKKLAISGLRVFEKLQSVVSYSWGHVWHCAVDEQLLPGHGLTDEQPDTLMILGVPFATTPRPPAYTVQKPTGARTSARVRCSTSASAGRSTVLSLHITHMLLWKHTLPQSHLAL